MNIWNPNHELVLASRSATRQRLLAAAGLPFESETPSVDERAVEAMAPERTPEAIARALARAKALDVSSKRPDVWVVGADQVLSIEERLIHKSQSLNAAHETLAQLAGRSHRLSSAFAVARGSAVVVEDADWAKMNMRPLDVATIGRYLDIVGEAALGSVGAYQWEGLGVHLFARVEGEHSTILGLPMLKLLTALRRVGALTL